MNETIEQGIALRTTVVIRNETFHIIIIRFNGHIVSRYIQDPAGRIIERVPYDEEFDELMRVLENYPS
jgi:hypothetical protein